MLTSPPLVRLALVASLLFLSFSSRAQTPASVLPGALNSTTDASAVITYAANQSVTATMHKGSSDRIGLQPNQIVAVTVQLTGIQVGRQLSIQPLDGGKLASSANRIVVGSDGTFSFRFQAGPRPGVSQLSIHDGEQEIGLQFWVLNTQDARCNPPVLTPTNSAY